MNFEAKLMSRHRIFLLVAGVLLFHASYAQDKMFDDSVLTQAGRQAYRTLLKEELFAVSGIGYSGETSQGEDAFNILVDEKEAVAAFRSLTRDATIEGGLYGLYGLRWKDCDCFQTEYLKFKQDKTSAKNIEELRFQSGCEGFNTAKNEDKEFFIEYFFKHVDGLMKARQRLHEYHMEIKTRSGGVKKIQ
jgi:hypothetical protein